MNFILLLFYKPDEVAYIEQPFPLFGSVGFMQSSRNNQLQVIGSHFVRLIGRYPRFKRE